MATSKKQLKHLKKLNSKQKLNNHPSWRGGQRKTGKQGYLRQSCPSHPFCDKYGYVLQHRLIVEKHIGRILLKSEVVHHTNGITSDNRIENLEILEKGEHTRLHRIGKKHTLETKQKLSNSKIGKKRTKEDIKKISNGHKGLKLSEETKRKIGLKSKERWSSKEFKRKTSITIKKGINKSKNEKGNR